MEPTMKWLCCLTGVGRSFAPTQLSWHVLSRLYQNAGWLSVLFDSAGMVFAAVLAEYCFGPLQALPVCLSTMSSLPSAYSKQYARPGAKMTGIVQVPSCLSLPDGETIYSCFMPTCPLQLSVSLFLVAGGRRQAKSLWLVRLWA